MLNISKITFNSLKKSLKKTKTGKPIWVWQQPKGKGKRPTVSQIKQFRALRTKASEKRERKKKVLIKRFRIHKTRSKNIFYTTYCIDFDDGNGIIDLMELFRSLGSAKKISSKNRIRFFVGSFNAFCLDNTVKCPKKKFIPATKKGGDIYIDNEGNQQVLGDKYNMPREQPDLTNDNFEDKYLNYLIKAQEQASAIYKSEVCPACGYNSLIEWIKICFQVIKVRS